MTPFRPTLDRVWESVHQLRYEHRTEQGYVIHMGPDLWADLVTDRSLSRYMAVDPLAKYIFGLPVKIEPRMRRGWVSLRHEITT